MPIHQTAYFVVRDDALERCQNAIREFVDHVRENEPDTLLYTSLQGKSIQLIFCITSFFVMKRLASSMPTRMQ